MISSLFRKWTAIKWFRMAMAAFLIGGGAVNSDWMSITLGGVLAAMTLLNAGCCAGGGCEIPAKGSN